MDAERAGVTLRRTPLFDLHRGLGAKIVPFAGWEMPLSYSGVVAEHHAVRTAMGLFDVSHMGRFELSGPDAARLIGRVATADPGKLAAGRMQYALALNESGGVLDDVMIYRLDASRYFVCVNASNREKLWDWFQKPAHDLKLELTDRTQSWAQIAAQGPCAVEVVAGLADPGLARIKPRAVVETRVCGTKMIVSRSGYTGEPGFELYLPAVSAAAVWDELARAGEPAGAKPCGLGCRDTLRLEAGYPLYGNDMDEATTPFEASLDFAVDFDNPDFIGRAALIKQKERGVSRKLAGFILRDGGVPRHGFRVFESGRPIGAVASGNHSPSLGRGIGLASLEPAFTKPGTAVEVEIRANRVPAEIVATPFYKRPKRV